MTMVVTPVSLYGNSSLLSDTVSLHVASTDAISSGSGYKSLVHMQTNSMLNISNHEEDVYVVTECAKGDVSSKYVTGCPDIDKENIVVACNGTAGSITTLCPQKQVVAACVQLQSSSTTSHLQCKLHSQTTDSITCLCEMSNHGISDRRFLNSNEEEDDYYSSSESNSNGVTINIGTMLTTVATDFISNWETAGDLSASDVIHSYDVAVTMGVLFATIIISLIVSHRKDNALKVEALEDSKSINHRLSTTKVLTKSKIPADVQSIESALPAAFASTPFLDRFVAENKKFHRWLGIIFYFSPNFPRVLRVVSLSTAVIVMLFIQAVTYNIAEADDGSCELNTDRTSCLDQPSTLARGESKCYWDREDNSCHFSEPSNDLLRVVFVAVISAMWSAPIAVFVDWIIMRVLAAKTSQTQVEVSKSNSYMAIGMQQRMSLALSQACKKSLEDEMIDLNKEIRQYYETLSGNEQHEFAGKTLLHFCY
jgi:hypothetical protein